MKNFTTFLTLLCFTTLISCQKEPGEGGTSTIRGKILVVNLNAEGDTVQAPYYAMDQDVFIIYGDENQTYDDKFATSLDGSFEFNYLTPGSYTIYAYSECVECPTGCDACPSGERAVIRTVEISEKKQEIVLEDIVILE